MSALHPLSSSIGAQPDASGLPVALVALAALLIVLRIVTTVVRMLDSLFAAALKVGVAVMVVGTVGLFGAVLYVAALVGGSVQN